ncbi:MAG: hypothetical protein KJ904_15460 [Alphaproteobacteria bacterium]|nr:hypothetical protein [Alphaproteobacteria bacterium]MBU0797434.1 hypothetical protein [Alphaproteobacteria bacterium]MBU0888553.1 hypothetical protein [Alphaproteobacteria bacterium]MBU1813713.1 hypothetical protein [Alphaproteobacteria bacterium]
MQIDTICRWGEVRWKVESVIEMEGIAHARLLSVDHTRDPITLAVSVLADKQRFRIRPGAVAV